MKVTIKICVQLLLTSINVCWIEGCLSPTTVQGMKVKLQKSTY